MVEFKYKLYRKGASDRIKDDISRMLGVLEGEIQHQKDNHTGERKSLNFDALKLRVALKDNILDFDYEYEHLVPNRQLITRENWQNILTLATVTYNEALLILLGINPALEELLDPMLFEVRRESELHNKPANSFSLICFRSLENLQLRRQFPLPKIKTTEILLWAIESKLLKQISTNDKQHKQTALKKSSINSLGRKHMLNNPGTTKSNLAIYISDDLQRLHNISLSPGTIRREYLEKYPCF